MEHLVLQEVAAQEDKLIIILIQHLVVQELLTKDMQEQALLAEMLPGDQVVEVVQEE